MKSTQIKRNNNETLVTEMKLQPVNGYKKQPGMASSYDGGFHIQSSTTSNKRVVSDRVVSKRSALQDFNCG